MSNDDKYPLYVDGKPPVMRLSEYDGVAWMNETCIDFDNSENTYYVVLFDEPTRKIARIDHRDDFKLNIIFKDAKEQMPKT